MESKWKMKMKHANSSPRGPNPNYMMLNVGQEALNYNNKVTEKKNLHRQQHLYYIVVHLQYLVSHAVEAIFSVSRSSGKLKKSIHHPCSLRLLQLDNAQLGILKEKFAQHKWYGLSLYPQPCSCQEQHHSERFKPDYPKIQAGTPLAGSDITA